MKKYFNISKYIPDPSEKYFELKPKFYQVIFLMTSKNYKVKKFDKYRKIAYHFKTQRNTILTNRNTYVCNDLTHKR